MNNFCRALRLMLAAVFLLAAWPAPAEDKPAAAKPQENRFLFIVDTASAMHSYSNEVTQAVVDLLGSDLRGELRRGDTMGLWTYNDRLHPEFPMQVWSKGYKDTIIENMGLYLQGQHYSRRANFAMVMPALNQIIKHSDRLTVILIFDGAELIRGTPFDKDINELQKKYAHELKAAHEPFILVLAARDGAIFDYTINYPGAVAIPHTALPPETPPEPKPPVAAAEAPAPETNAPPPAPPPLKVGPSIFVTGPPQVYHGPVAPAPERPVTQVTVTPTPPPVAPPPAPVVKSAAPPPVVTPVSTPATVSAAPPPAPRPIIVSPPVQPPPAPVVVKESPPPVKEIAAPAPAPVTVTANTPTPPPTEPPVVHSAPVAAAAPPPGGAPITLFVMAFLLLTIAIVLVWFLMRRSRQAPQSSIISQSINRPR